MRSRTGGRAERNYVYCDEIENNNLTFRAGELALVESRLMKIVLMHFKLFPETSSSLEQ
jgi:hypothetical protein